VKRKAVSMIGSAGFPGALKKAVEKDVVEKDSGSEEDEVEDEQAMDEEPESREDAWARQEEETKAAKRKELKSMYLDELKELAVSNGLEADKKENMIEAIITHEANARAQIRKHEDNIRAAVVNKKEELEGMSAPDLKELCASKGIAGALTKQERVVQLLNLWQDADGIDQTLAKMAHDAREAELVAMDKETLKKVCDKAGVNPLITVVMVDRIIDHEVAAGRFAPPVLKKVEESPKSKTTSDLVENLLANEAGRKKEVELKRQREEKDENKRKELRAMSNEDLKKLLAKKGKEPEGKKDDMVEACFAIYAQEEATASRRDELKSLSADDLRKVVLNNGLEFNRNKDKMIESLLAHEAKVRDAAHAHKVKSQDVLKKALKEKKVELESKTAAELKDLCTSKGLKAGTANQDRVERLLEAAAADVEVNKLVALMDRSSRRDELLSMDQESLQKICVEIGVNPLVKEIMIERILSHERDHGPTKLDGEPAPKKMRTRS